MISLVDVGHWLISHKKGKIFFLDMAMYPIFLHFLNIWRNSCNCIFLIILPIWGEGLIYFNRQLRIMICCVHVIYISLCCGGQFIDGGHTHGVCVWGGNQRVSMNPSPLKTKKDLGWTMIIKVWNFTHGHKTNV